MIACLLSKFRIAVFSTLVFSIAALSARSASAQSTADEEREACKKNLSTIYKAIKSYRADRKDLPPYLSDLIPKFIKDPNTLVCPSVKRTGTVVNYGITDPKISTAYIYEFSESPIPESQQGGLNHTMKEWKRRQMGLVGSKIPMVRCHHHNPVLNLSFDGKVYEGASTWEAELQDEIDPADLTPAKLFAAESALEAKLRSKTELPSRDPKTSPNLVDLSKFYNAALTEGWHRTGPNEPIANDLSALPQGVQKLADVDFDVRGVIQYSSQKLYSSRFPLASKDIKVDGKAKKLHFLHATGWSAPEGTPVATAVVHLANGKTHEFTFNYGEHLVDWITWDPQLKDRATSVVAWTGKSSATGGQTTLHLFRSQWINPEPDQTIASVDYVASNLDPAPFLIAITAEP
jgi:hypothetical protein